MKITFIFSCFGKFWHVPACSGMFHVPGFIDAPKFVHRALIFVNKTELRCHDNEF